MIDSRRAYARRGNADGRCRHTDRRRTVANFIQLRTMRKIFIRELRRICTRPIYLFCMVIVPLFCAVLLTTLMGQGLPTEMPVGIVDMDNSVTTRALARNLDAFQNTHVTHRFASVPEAVGAMRRGEVYAFYYVPEGTTRKLLRQESPKVSFYTNNAYLMAGSLLYKDMRTMSELVGGSATRSVLLAKGATGAQAMAFLQPIVIDAHPIGNPALNYSIYLSNVLIPGLLSLMIFFVTVFSIGQEIKEGEGRALLVLAKGSPLKALYAKLAAQFVIFALVGLFVGLYLYGLLGYPCRCGIPVMLLLLTLMVLASQGLGVLMIAALPSPRLGLSFASLWGVISFSICGMSFPALAMYPVLHGLSYLFPLRYYYLLYVNCALDGFSLSGAAPFVGALAAFALLPLLFVGRFRHMMERTAYVP